MAKPIIDLSTITEDALLNLRIKDLGLAIKGTWLEDAVKELYLELESKGIRFKPTCYLADEWFTPDKQPQIAIPFFLTHPALIKLEKKTMLETEGETKSWCMKLLRHETGHAINYAYRLYQLPEWKKTFGQFSKEYGDTYRFRPYSRSFVKHLEDYYAQYHPDEDFAETFAVWLTPNLDWQSQYKGWKALEKLQYVDKIMQEIKDKPAFIKNGPKYRNISSLDITLKNYYKKKKSTYAENFPDFHDANLIKIFPEKHKEDTRLPYAHSAIKLYKNSIANSVSVWTGEKKFIVNDLLEKIIQRCKYLGLLNPMSEQQTVIKVSTYVTALVANYVHTGKFTRH